MNTWILWGMAAAVGLGCSSSSNTITGARGYAAELETAKATWASTKPSCPDYHYDAISSSVFGSCSKTTVDIANDQPVHRSYAGYTNGECGHADAGPAETWEEVGAQAVGTHADGAPALTAEQLFTACQASLAHDPSMNTLTLTVGSTGVPTRCGYTPINCLDDCYSGFELSDVTCGPWVVDGGSVDAPN
jgi:hypothetical protein